MAKIVGDTLYHFYILTFSNFKNIRQPNISDEVVNAKMTAVANLRSSGLQMFKYEPLDMYEASKRKMRENALNREHNEQQVTEANVNDDDVVVDVDE